MPRRAASVTDLATLTQSYLLTCRAEGKSPQTVHWYEHKLRGFIDWLDRQADITSARAVTPEHVRCFLDHLRSSPDPWQGSTFQPTRPVGTRSPYTVKGYAQVIKGFYTWLDREGHLRGHALTRLRMPKVPKKLIRPLAPADVRALLAAPDTRMVSGIRDAAILSVLLDCGLRAGELVALRPGDVGRGELVVTGKGSKTRVVGFGTTTQKALTRWLAARATLTDEHRSGGRLFVNERGEPLTRNAVEKQVRHYGERARLDRRVWPHLLRHTFAVSFLRAGGDAFTLQRLLGHTSLETTRLYVELAEGDILEVYRRASPLDNLKRLVGVSA